MWWPLWGFNIGEYWQNSVLPIAEMQTAGVIDRDIMLTPEVGGWPLRDYHTGMLSPFPRHAVRTTGQLAPKCTAERTCPPPRCFERMLVCKFRDVYDGQPPVAPWSAARAVVAAMRSPQRTPVVAAASDVRSAFVVLFASRAAAKNGARQITNEAQLLQLCNQWSPPPACVGPGRAPGLRARCELRAFGRRGFRRDVEAVQSADVLVGTHGAALVHAIFMQLGAALLEVRPFGFVGKWPDQYHVQMARAENEVRPRHARHAHAHHAHTTHTPRMPQMTRPRC